MEVRDIINELEGVTVYNIVIELLHEHYYIYNPLAFYQFFGLQGGTVWQLAIYILQYKKSLV